MNPIDYLTPEQKARLDAARACDYRGLSSNQGDVFADGYVIAECRLHGYRQQGLAKHIAANDPQTVEATLLELGRLRGLVVAILNPDLNREFGPAWKELREAVGAWINKKAGEQ